MIYQPRYLPGSNDFECLVHLVLEQEHPNGWISTIDSPDSGIDITREEAGCVHVYQCKHYRNPNRSDFRRAVRDSLVRAINYRSKLNWKDYTLCTSENLNIHQHSECKQLAKDVGISSREFRIRTGNQFIATLRKHPWIWESVTSQAFKLNYRAGTYGSVHKPLWVDSKLRRIVAKALQQNSRRPLVETLHEHGISNIAMSDWYEVAAHFLASTHFTLRAIALDEEIPAFWLTDAGSRCFELNKTLLAKGVRVQRIYAVDLALATSAPECFRTIVSYISEHESAGIACRVMDIRIFSETVRLNCGLFGVQDKDNIVFFSPDGAWVTILHDRAHASEATDMYDELFASRECISLTKLRTYSR